MTKQRNRRKIIWITMAVILLPFVSFWLFLQYQIRQSYQTRIPVSTNAIIKVDVYAIYKSMLGEFFRKRKDSRTEEFKGIDLPANLFFYTLGGKQSTTLLTSLPIKNLSEFEKSLKSWQLIPSTLSLKKDIHLFTNAEGSLTLLYNDKTIAFAYSKDKEPVTDELMAILENSNMIAVSDSKFKAIEKQTGHISFLAGDKTGSLDFNKGNIHALIHLPLGDFTVPTEVKHQIMPSESAAQMWLYADLKPMLAGKQYSIGNVIISGDSLARSNPRGIEWMIDGTSIVQKDSIVTYEYNDDFEKVATVTVNERHVPGIYGSLNAEASALSGYLERQQILLADSGIINKEVFPLYQLYVTQTDAFFSINTVKTTTQNQHDISSPNFLSVDMNFEKLLQQQEFAILHKYIGSYKRLKATGTKGKDNITIDATLYFKNSKESALLQFMRAYL